MNKNLIKNRIKIYNNYKDYFKKQFNQSHHNCSNNNKKVKKRKKIIKKI